jgi:hypothetical protein
VEAVLSWRLAVRRWRWTVAILWAAWLALGLVCGAALLSCGGSVVVDPLPDAGLSLPPCPACDACPEAKGCQLRAGASWCACTESCAGPCGTACDGAELDAACLGCLRDACGLVDPTVCPSCEEAEAPPLPLDALPWSSARTLADIDHVLRAGGLTSTDGATYTRGDRVAHVWGDDQDWEVWWVPVALPAQEGSAD